MTYYNIPGYANSEDYEKAAKFYYGRGERERAIDMLDRALEAKCQEKAEKEYDRQYRDYWGDFWD